MSDMTKQAGSQERTQAEEAREIIILLGYLIDRIDKACLKYGVTRAGLFGAGPKCAVCGIPVNAVRRR